MNNIWLVVLVVIVIWATISFTDMVFKSCMLHPYVAGLEKAGISISLGKFKFFTNRFNRWFYKIAQIKSRFTQIWFVIGGIFGVVAIIPSILALLRAIYNNVSMPSGPAYDSQQIMVAIVPGVNLPVSQLVYYFVALLLCSVFHELGHAVAAYSEGITIDGIGLFIFGVLPSAFVDIPTSQLNRLSVVQQLRIFCAGIWHNFVLCVAAYIILLVVPVIHEPFYAQNVGVLITSVTQETPIGGTAGLVEGDRITHINDCIVDNIADWSSCLVAALNRRNGYCLPDISVSQAEIVFEQTTKKNLSCCPTDNPSGLCFKKLFNQPETGCYHARAILDESRGQCNISSPCRNPKLSCVVPILNDVSSLIILHREDKQNVIFLGHPGEVYQSVSVSNYIPRFSWLPSKLPVQIEHVLKYVISFSAGLGILNSIPCMFLDGQHITRLTIDLLFASVIKNKETRANFSAIVVFGGTVLLVINVLLALWRIM